MLLVWLGQPIMEDFNKIHSHDLQASTQQKAFGDKAVGACGCVDIMSFSVVAVHGLDGDLTNTWTDPTTRVLWLRDLFPAALNVVRVLTFGYNAETTAFYGSGSADRIQQHAHTLVAELQADRALEECSQRPIIFLCHGLGGILVKKALAYSSSRTSRNLEHLYSVFTSTYAVLFFGTPHCGTEKGSWIPRSRFESVLARTRHRKESVLLSAVEKDSETLQAIADQFGALMRQFHIFFFWEEVKTKVGEESLYVVEESSAAPVIDNTERAGINANHAQMVRFSSRSTSSYRIVIEALVRYCRDAPRIIEYRWQQATDSLSRARNNEAFELVGMAFDMHNEGRPFKYERKASARPRNRYFQTPQAVSSIFTGRERTSWRVREAFWGSEEATIERQQRRFIIHGIGGSGKTQFCSKFAQDHRERFWGVFWIDATSAETAKQSFAALGKLGELEATQNAGKHWLSNSEEPWLLIINNADDPSLDLQNLFPEGERGFILVTTRNPNFSIHHTVGAAEFKGLEQEEALHLLLRAAGAPRPWDHTVESLGNDITHALGYLALALIQAGALIFQKLCDLKDYLDFYNEYRREIGGRRRCLGSDNEDQLPVYATWEHSLDALSCKHNDTSRDAVQLLSTVAFFHFERIRVDIFAKALTNICQEQLNVSKAPFSRRLSHAFWARMAPPPLFPVFLQQRTSKADHYRIKRALHELHSFSLLSYDGKDDSFSLHPVVHSWARDRLAKGEQAVWAQIAVNVLAQSVLLPPKDTGEAHENYRRDILVHLDHCLRACPIEILDYQAYFGGLKIATAIFRYNWLSVYRHQVFTAARCGYVYLERGRFADAVVLFCKAKDALIQSRGYEDENTARAMLALAKGYWGLGRLDEAIALQKQVVKARTCRLGPDHTETLAAMDELGQSYWLNGQYKDALELQEPVKERKEAILGLDDISTLTSVDLLGVTYSAWQRWEESKKLHERVLKARTKLLGPSDLDTLLAMNNLAMALNDLGRYQEAKRLMTTVVEQRRAKLGKEHPWTLWAICNLAKINTGLELLKEAEDLLDSGLAAAVRSLGEDHLGTLMGFGELARVYSRQGRVNQAVDLMEELVPRLESSRGPEHPDTVYALYKLVQLYEKQQKWDRAAETSELAETRAEPRLTKEHPISRKIAAQRRNIERQLQRVNGGAASNLVHETVSHDPDKTTSPARCSAEPQPKPLQTYNTF
ncbi:MAG: hypothetical protein Q9213_006304 [Squamulea squamosa]